MTHICTANNFRLRCVMPGSYLTPIEECLESYQDVELGCSPNWKGLNNSIGTPPCAANKTLRSYREVWRRLKYAGEYKIFNMTGCRSSCRQSVFRTRYNN